jgi:DNA-binding LacI/PurR family transcriptional regulator
MEEEKTSVREDSRINCRTGWSEDELEAYFRSVMDRTPPPTAFFCLDDEIAIRVWNSLRNLGYSIPENISILAPGDVLDYSKPYIPQITTMHIDMKYIGGLAVGMLVNRLKNDSEAVHVLKVKQQLIERKSCRKPRLPRTGLL